MQRPAVRTRDEIPFAQKSDIQHSLLPKGMQLSEYLRLAKEALTQHDAMGKKFTHNIVGPRNNGSIEFSWSIKLTDAPQSPRDEVDAVPLPVQFSVRGCLTLTREKDEKGLLGTYLDLLVEQKDLLRQENAKLLKHNETFLAEKQRSAAMLDKLLDEKKALERDLYTKFVIVLNEKKRKIRALKEQIQELTSGPPAVATSAGAYRNAPAAEKDASQGHHSSSDSERETRHVRLMRRRSSAELRQRSQSNLHASLQPTPSIPLLDADEMRLEPTIRRRARATVDRPSERQGSFTRTAPHVFTAPVAPSSTPPPSLSRRAAAPPYANSPKVPLSPRSDLAKKRKGQTQSVDVEHLLDDAN